MRKMTPLVRNILWYQAIWFLAILLGDAAVTPIFMLLTWHIASSPDRSAEFIVMLGCGALGYATDGLLAASGLYQFPAGSGDLPAPLWLFGLWLGFAGTLRHSLASLVRRPLLLALLGLVGAPTSYLAAMRLGAVSFPQGTEVTLIIVGATWFALLPLFCYWCHRCERRQAKAANLLNTFGYKEGVSP